MPYYVKGSYLYDGKPSPGAIILSATRLPEAYQQFNDHLCGKQLTVDITPKPCMILYSEYSPVIDESRSMPRREVDSMNFKYKKGDRIQFLIETQVGSLILGEGVVAEILDLNKDNDTYFIENNWAPIASIDSTTQLKWEGRKPKTDLKPVNLKKSFSVNDVSYESGCKTYNYEPTAGATKPRREVD